MADTQALTPRHALLCRIRDTPGTLRLSALPPAERNAAARACGDGLIPSLGSALLLTPSGWAALAVLDELHAARTDPRQRAML